MLFISEMGKLRLLPLTAQTAGIRGGGRGIVQHGNKSLIIHVSLAIDCRSVERQCQVLRVDPVCMQDTENQLIAQHAPLVRRLALQLVARLPANVELDDLMQAGMMGLLDAVRRYELQDDAKFETYATTRIRGAMLDELRSQDWLSRGARSKARDIEAAVLRIQQRELRAATEEEIAAELGVSLDEYFSMLDDASGVQLVHYEDLSPGAGSGEGSEMLDRMAIADEDPAQHQDNPLNLLLSRNLHAAVMKAIDDLPEREKLLLSLQFEHDLNQKEISAVMGVTEGRISQLRSQAVARIRAKLRLK